MKLLYIVFYIVLDLMIFSFLIKKIRMSKTIWKTAIGFICLFTIIHFLNPMELSIPNERFFILIGFSMVLFLFKFGKTVSIRVYGVLNKNKDELLMKWFEFWTDYVVYIMVLATQIGTIISN